MRVVISDLPPEFPEKIKLSDEDYPVTDDEDVPIFVDAAGNVKDPPADVPPIPAPPPVFEVLAKFELGMDRIMELLAEARESDDKIAFIDVNEPGVTLNAFDGDDVKVIPPDVLLNNVSDASGSIDISVGDLERLLSDLQE